MKMIDVGDKERTSRVAVARAELRCAPETLQRLRDGLVEKGDAIAAAKIAAIQAAKKTPDLLPLCHPIVLAGVDCHIEIDDAASVVRIETRVHALERTGVEMEALTAACAAALTLYDMLKRHDKGMELVSARLVEKSGGRSGDWHRADEKAPRTF